MATPGQQNITTTSQPPNFQLPSLDRLMGVANQIVEQPKQYFPQSTVAGQNPLQTGAQQNVVQYAQGAAAPLISNALGANQFTLSAMDPASNPYLQAAAQNAAFPIVRNWEQQINPMINQGAAREGVSGSTRHGIAQGLGAQAAVDAVQRATTGMFSDAYETGLDASLKSQALAPSLISAGLLPAQMQASVGDVIQAQDQAQLQDQINRFNFGQVEPTMRAQDFQAMISGNYGGTSASQGTASGPTPSATELALAGGALGASIAGPLADTGWFGEASAGEIAPYSAAGGALLSFIFP